MVGGLGAAWFDRHRPSPAARRPRPRPADPGLRSDGRHLRADIRRQLGLLPAGTILQVVCVAAYSLSGAASRHPVPYRRRLAPPAAPAHTSTLSPAPAIAAWLVTLTGSWQSMWWMTCTFAGRGGLLSLYLSERRLGITLAPRQTGAASRPRPPAPGSACGAARPRPIASRCLPYSASDVSPLNTRVSDAGDQAGRDAGGVRHEDDATPPVGYVRFPARSRSSHQRVLPPSSANSAVRATEIMYVS